MGAIRNMNWTPLGRHLYRRRIAETAFQVIEIDAGRSSFLILANTLGNLWFWSETAAHFGGVTRALQRLATSLS